MVDFRVCDTFGDHPKMFGLPLAAVGLWTLGGAWCAKHLTDGYIPDTVLLHLAGKRRALIDQLQQRALIERLGDGWVYVNWSEYQRSRAEVENEREQWRTRQRTARERQRQSRVTEA